MCVRGTLKKTVLPQVFLCFPENSFMSIGNVLSFPENSSLVEVLVEISVIFGTEAIVHRITGNFLRSRCLTGDNWVVLGKVGFSGKLRGNGE